MGCITTTISYLQQSSTKQQSPIYNRTKSNNRVQEQLTTITPHFVVYCSVARTVAKVGCVTTVFCAVFLEGSEGRSPPFRAGSTTDAGKGRIKLRVSAIAATTGHKKAARWCGAAVVVMVMGLEVSPILFRQQRPLRQVCIALSLNAALWQQTSN